MQFPENVEFDDILSDGIAVYFQAFSVFLSLPLRSIRTLQIFSESKECQLKTTSVVFLCTVIKIVFKNYSQKGGQYVILPLRFYWN